MNLLKTTKHLRTDALRVVDCHNLRPADTSKGDVLTPVGSPEIVAPRNWEPLIMAGESLLIVSDCTVGVAGAGGVQKIATLPGKPLCAYASHSYVTVMTETGAYLIKRNDDGSFTDIGLKPDFGAIAITAQQLSQYESTIEACSVANITSAMTAAYREIVETARLGGAFVQPVLARCRLLDAEQNVLHITAPVVVMLPDGAPLTAAWQFGSDDDGTTIRAKVVSAPAYRLRISVGDAIPNEWRKIVQTIEVQVTPQFHPIDFSGQAEVNIGRASSTDNYIRVTLPGVERGISATRNLASAELLKRAIERFDDIATTIAYISNPYDSDADSIITYAAPIDVADEADSLASALSKDAPARVSADLARVSVPHSFVAEGVAHSAGTVVWSAITPQRFGGYAAGVYASAFERKSCSGYVATTFADGERVMSQFTSNIAPQTLSPLIVYPSAEATEITIAVQLSGESSMRIISVPLTPDATGKFAFYADNNLLPISFNTTPVHDAPTANAARQTMSGYIAVSNDAAVPSVTAVSTVGDKIDAVIAARSGSSAWEYRRARFYAFANDGIKLLTVSSDRTTCAVNLLDCRCIDNKYCVSDGGNVVYILSAGSLLQISANTVKCIEQNVVGDRLAWIAADNEIVVANTDDSEAAHYSLDSPGCYYSSSLAPLGAWLSAAGKAYAVTGDGLVNLASRTVAASTDVRWSAYYVMKSNCRKLPSCVRWMLKASDFNGRLSVARAWLTGIAPSPQTISCLTVSGAIKSPIVCRMHGHRSIDLQLTVEGSVSRDFAFTYPKIISD